MNAIFHATRIAQKQRSYSGWTKNHCLSLDYLKRRKHIDVFRTDKRPKSLASSAEQAPSDTLGKRPLRKWNKPGFKDHQVTYLSIQAYNLCEELRLDKVSCVLSSFDGYRNVNMPSDTINHVVHLRASPNSASGRSQHQDIASKASKDIFMFNEGSVVFWNIDHAEQQALISALTPIKVISYPDEIVSSESEQLDYTFDDSIEKSKLSKGNIILNPNPDTRQLDQYAFSHAIALSVKLSIWESLLDQYIQSIGWVTNSMKTGNRIDLTRGQVFRKTGELYELKHQLNLNSDLLDTPDFYWDRQELEDLFLKTISYMNVKKRTSVMNEKLNNCCELMHLLSSHMSDKHHVRLEWMIIVLIMVEVLFEIAHFL